MPTASRPLARLVAAWHLVLLVALAPRGVQAQTVTEWSAEQRLTLSFHVNDAALQKLMPAGWTVAPSTAPANPGGNINVSFIDRMVVFDGQGKQYRAGSSRYIVFTVPARNAEGVANNIIIAGLSPEGAGAYGVNLTATTSRVQKSATTQGEDNAQVEERWEFAADSGERVSLRVAYRRAPTTKSRAETKIRSAIRPEFTRTYRIEQAADVLRSANTPDRIETVALTIAGPKLAPVFNGSEQLLSITAFPYYTREIAVP